MCQMLLFSKLVSALDISTNRDGKLHAKIAPLKKPSQFFWVILSTPEVLLSTPIILKKNLLLFYP